MKRSSSTTLAAGLTFSALWASASVAGKFGLFSVEPLVLFTIRFLAAGTILLVVVYGFQGIRTLPTRQEWKQLTIFGAFNTTLYLGLFVLALQSVTPGITSLAIALNPLFISVMSAIGMKKKITWVIWLSVVLGICGVGLAAYPLLHGQYASTHGMVLLGLSMLTYSFGAVYYAAVPWQLPRLTINAWQVLIGGILLLPGALLMHSGKNEFDGRFWLSLLWLIFPVSIGAVQLWLRLLKSDAVGASLWLYLCPLFGFFYANLFLDEPITVYTFLGTLLVVAALYLGQRKTTA